MYRLAFVLLHVFILLILVCTCVVKQSEIMFIESNYCSFFPPSTDGGGIGKVCRVPKLFSDFSLALIQYFEAICNYHSLYLQHVLSTKAWG